MRTDLTGRRSFVRPHSAAVLAHFMRLLGADRQMRFLQVMPDVAIEAYVAKLDFSMCFGVFAKQYELVAFAEVFLYRAGTRLMAEAAFSTDERWRRRGLAHKLCRVLGDHAASAGVDRVVLHCHRGNTPMRALLRAINAATSVDETDVEAEWDPTR
jgi:RimJ/RimL family protein N-acetyltransferase